MQTQMHGARAAKTLTKPGFSDIDLRPDVTQVEFANSSQITGHASFIINGQRRTAADTAPMAEAQGFKVNQAATKVGPY